MPYRIFLIALLLIPVLAACTRAATPPPPSSPDADLEGIKTYLLDKTARLKASAAELQAHSQRYYDLAQAGHFDYAALATHPGEVAPILMAAKSAWMAASPLYEQMEGIVAGVPLLSEYDLILDAGASGAQDPANAAPYDLTLPDGRILEKPGNLFGVLESALWGTEATFQAARADLDANGVLDFGESLPDANILKAAAGALLAYIGELETAARAWQPTESEAFTALVVMIPTMNEYFSSWKASRFVSGTASTQRDFVAISRLADIQDILGGLQVVYQGIQPLATGADPEQADQIGQALAGLKGFVSEVYNQEQNGRHFGPEEADILSAEAQNRATALAGQITQIAARLNIPLD